ncbi:MAG TPA: ATP-binding protein [Coriobacteriia bacterium]|nr:ATP-binding protein [Coriobacteriia bacterium]
MTNDCIYLTVPAKAEYAKTVRMTAAALVSRMGMTYDEVDDVKMAAEEAFIYAVDTLAEDAEVRFTFELADEALEILVVLGGEADVSDDEVERRTSYATFILESVVDGYELLTDESGTKCMRLHKTAGGVDAV